MNSYVVLLGCFLMGSSACASTGLRPSIPVDQYRLSNGLTVVLSKDSRVPVVAVEVRYRVGSSHERPGRTGFAHLFEHLMFQGSKSYNDEYFKPFEPIGGRINGTTSNDRTNYYQQVPSNYLELALWMESDRMANLLPVLTRKKLDNQRKVVKNERRQNYEDRPYGIAQKHLANSMYPKGHPYHHLTIGSHADLTAASLQDVKSFFRQYYNPNNAILVIAGDINIARTKQLVTAYFGGIAKGKRAPKPAAPNPRLNKIVTVHDVDKVKLPRIYLAWHSPALYAKGDAALDIWSSVLADGKNSRLYKSLVYEQRVAKDVTAYQVSRYLGSTFIVMATAAPGKSARTLYNAMTDVLRKAMAKPPTADEFNRILNGWQKMFFANIESVLHKASLLAGYAHMTGKADYIGRDLVRYTKLNPEAVFNAATRYLPLDRFVKVVISPKPAAVIKSKQGGM